jgi:hypothetical protein
MKIEGSNLGRQLNLSMLCNNGDAALRLATGQDTEPLASHVAPQSSFEIP